MLAQAPGACSRAGWTIPASHEHVTQTLPSERPPLDELSTPAMLPDDDQGSLAAAEARLGARAAS